MEKITIDYKRLCAEITRAGKTKQSFSFELGKSKGYICTLRNNPNIPENMVNLMCILLGVEKKQLMPLKVNVEKESGNVAILGNIYTKICEVASNAEQSQGDNKANLKMIQTLTEVSESIDVIRRKVSANTIQIERIRDILAATSETEEQRAERFLADMLSGGEAEAADIFRQADELCIKRSELMKAKNKLDVKPYTTGYGKNQKAMWRI